MTKEDDPNAATVGVIFSKKGYNGEPLREGMLGVRLGETGGTVWRLVSPSFGLATTVRLPNTSDQATVVLSCIEK